METAVKELKKYKCTNLHNPTHTRYINAERFEKNDKGDKYEFFGKELLDNKGNPIKGSDLIGSLRITKHWEVKEVDKIDTCPHCGGEL